MKIRGLICVVFFSVGLITQAQMHNVGRAYLSKGEELLTTKKVKEQSRGKKFKNKLISISENEVYITFVPRVPYRKSIFEDSSFPIFTYLKKMDVVILRVNETDRKAFSGKEFFKGGFQPTKTIKNYLNTPATKYTTAIHLYELALWVAEGKSNVEEVPFLSTLKRMNILQLGANKKVVAIEYAGLEIPIELIEFKVESKYRTMNPEVFKRKDTSKASFILKEVPLKEVPKEILHKEYVFNESYTTENINKMLDIRDAKTDSSSNRVLVNKKQKTNLVLYDKKFSLTTDQFILSGKTEGTQLKIEKVFKRRSQTRYDLQDFKIIHQGKSGTASSYEIVACNLKSTWSCNKYTVLMDRKYKKSFSEIALPNKRIKGYLQSAEGIYFNYGDRSTYEYTFNHRATEVKKLTSKEKYTLHE